MRSKYFKLLSLGIGLLWAPVAYSAEIVGVEKSSSSSKSVIGSTVIPYKEVTLAAQIPGRIVNLGGDVGSTFNPGALLAKVGDEALVAKKNAVMAQLSTAQAALKNSQTQYQREVIAPRREDISAMPGFGLPTMMDTFMTRPMADMMGVGDSDMTRYSDLMNSATGVSQAQGGVQQALAQLKELETKIRDSQSIAPFAGMILQKMVEVGDTVQPGQPLLKYGQVNYLRLKADVPSGLINNLSKGMVVDAKVDGTSSTKAKVSQIYPIADPVRHTVVVKFDLPVDIVAAPGMYAEISLPSKRKNGNGVLLIPKTSLLQGRSLPSVLLVKGDTSVLRLVRLGAERGDKVEVVSGLSAEDRVIDNPPAGKSSGYMPGSE